MAESIAVIVILEGFEYDNHTYHIGNSILVRTEDVERLIEIKCVCLPEEYSGDLRKDFSATVNTEDSLNIDSGNSGIPE